MDLAFRDPIELQETIDKCHKLIMKGVSRGMTQNELARIINYAAALDKLKNSMIDASNACMFSRFAYLCDKYLEEDD